MRTLTFASIPFLGLPTRSRLTTTVQLSKSRITEWNYDETKLSVYVWNKGVKERESESEGEMRGQEYYGMSNIEIA